MRPPLVSVVVPCHNYGRYLGDCLQSILRQRVDDIEVVVVDDGSTDETTTVLANFNDARIRVIRHESNLGLLATLTNGILATRGKHVARIDADDRYRVEFLEEAVRILETSPNVGLVYGDVAAMDASGCVTEEPWRGIRSREVHGGRDACGDEFLTNLEDNTIPAPAMMARGDLYRAALPFPSWFTSPGPSDWYLNLRIARTHLVHYRARTFGDYRLHASNLHRQAPRMAHYEQTVVGVLDEMLAGADRAAEKRAIRARLYSRAYLSFANSYFSRDEFVTARRRYLKAIWQSPRHGLAPVAFRRLLTTLLPPGVYRRLKGAR